MFSTIICKVIANTCKFTVNLTHFWSHVQQPCCKQELYNFDVSEALFQKFSTGCKNHLKVVLTLRGEVLSGGKFIMRQIYLKFTKYLQYITHVYWLLLNIQKWETLHKYLNGFEAVLFMQHKTKINGGILVQQWNVWRNSHTSKANDRHFWHNKFNEVILQDILEHFPWSWYDLELIFRSAWFILVN